MIWADQAAEILRNETGVVLTSTLERLALAALLGGAIGLEREFRRKAAGLRTNMLICFGAAMFTVLSAELAHKVGGDSVRIASQIIPGIGFIGAGSILRDRGSISGLTSAATIFVTASVGMAAGGGMYVTAIFGTIVILLALKVLGRLELRFEYRLNTSYEVTGSGLSAVLNEVERILAGQNLCMHDVHTASLHDRARVVFSVEGIRPGDNSVELSLHQSGVFASVQSLGRSGRE